MSLTIISYHAPAYAASTTWESKRVINDCTHPPGFCVAIEPQTTTCQRTIVAQTRLQQYLPAPLNSKLLHQRSRTFNAMMISPACRQYRTQAHA